MNTCFTSIVARRREFAVLQSIGMTGYQLRKMLITEGGFYAVLTVLVSAMGGSLATYSIVQALAGFIWYFNWKFTLIPIMLSILPLLLVCLLVPMLCYRKASRESLVDRLRID